MKHMSIAGKILALLMIVGLVESVCAAFAGWTVMNITAEFVDLAVNDQPGALYLAEAGRSFEHAHGTIIDAVTTQDPAIVAHADAQIKEARARIEHVLALASTALHQDPIVPELRNRMLSVIDDGCGKTLDMSRQARTADDRAAAIGEFAAHCRPLFAPVVDAVSATIDAENQENSDRGKDLATATTTAVSISIGLIVSGAAAALCAGFFISRASITRPVRELAEAMKRMAGGDLDIAVPGVGRRDEIGTMSAAVDVFRENGRQSRDLEAAARRMREEAEEHRADEQARTNREAAELRIATAALGGALQRLAVGDLSCRIDQAFAEDYENLRFDFNCTLDQLNRTMGQVVHSVESMESDTREISAGADDLSRRTEQQAASLEETAAALDEITANVTNSTRLSEEARGVARAATESAARSAVVVSHAEQAMQRIEQSSQQISNIIGVIDDIAFQTNLLALNAGVEAARAGQAGKGFAVVAQEVRELAQRSASAAKEIKELIRNSTTEVDGGVKLVRETGAALNTIAEHITRINSHMEAIATSSREQSTGLAEVNSAVNSMDQTTQQNAAMVEQSNAAASALALEAARLRELVSGFRLADGGMQVERLRQTAAVMARSAR